MDYYLSGSVSGSTDKHTDIHLSMIQSGYCRLLTFAYEEQLWRYVNLAKEHGARAKLMIDSGAFTAWSKGEEVNREALASVFDRVNSVPGIDALLINLDRIPGRKGVDPTESQVEAAMEESEQNFDWLSARFPGRVLPVYHQGEPTDYLLRLAAANDYICLSPRNDLPEHLRVAWAQETHAKIPGKRTHGLATTGTAMMSTSPWASVDSAAWVMVAAYGGIWVLRGEKISVLTVSDESEARRELGKHLSTLPESEKAALDQFVGEQGFDLALLCTDYWQRFLWNAHIGTSYAAGLNVKHVHQPGFF